MGSQVPLNWKDLFLPPCFLFFLFSPCSSCFHPPIATFCKLNKFRVIAGKQILLCTFGLFQHCLLRLIQSLFQSPIMNHLLKRSHTLTQTCRGITVYVARGKEACVCVCVCVYEKQRQRKRVLNLKDYPYIVNVAKHVSILYVIMLMQIDQIWIWINRDSLILSTPRYCKLFKFNEQQNRINIFTKLVKPDKCIHVPKVNYHNWDVWLHCGDLAWPLS